MEITKEQFETDCPRCQNRGTIKVDLFKEMNINRAERRRRGKDDGQRFKYLPCPECKTIKE